MTAAPTLEAERAAPNQYRKKPVVIEAIQWPGNKFVTTPPEWFKAAMYAEPGTPGFVMRWGDDILIETLEGQVRASPGDWIIRGIKGELYPCKPDIFAATYEVAAPVAEGVALPPLDAEGLPPLPEPAGIVMVSTQAMRAFTAEQVRQAQRDAVKADRARQVLAWAVFADNGNVIIWSRRRGEVEPVAAKYGKTVVPVIAYIDGRTAGTTQEKKNG